MNYHHQAHFKQEAWLTVLNTVFTSDSILRNAVNQLVNWLVLTVHFFSRHCPPCSSSNRESKNALLGRFFGLPCFLAQSGSGSSICWWPYLGRLRRCLASRSTRLSCSSLTCLASSTVLTPCASYASKTFAKKRSAPLAVTFFVRAYLITYDTTSVPNLSSHSFKSC